MRVIYLQSRCTLNLLWTVWCWTVLHRILCVRSFVYNLCMCFVLIFSILIKLSLIISDANAFYATHTRAIVMEPNHMSSVLSDIGAWSALIRFTAHRHRAEWSESKWQCTRGFIKTRCREDYKKNTSFDICFFHQMDYILSLAVFFSSFFLFWEWERERNLKFVD